MQTSHWRRSLCTELERKTLASRLEATLFASPCTAACSRLGSGGTVISILSDVIQLASRLVAVTFRTVWTFSVKYTYSTLLTFAWESLTPPYLAFFFPGNLPTLVGISTPSRGGSASPNRELTVWHRSSLFLRLQLDEVFPVNVIPRYRRNVNFNWIENGLLNLFLDDKKKNEFQALQISPCFSSWLEATQSNNDYLPDLVCLHNS